MAKKKLNANQMNFLDNYGKTAPAVPAIRQAVQEWAADGYKGATATSMRLLNYWFHTDHKLDSGGLFHYNRAPRGSMEALIYVFLVVRTRKPKNPFLRIIKPT